LIGLLAGEIDAAGATAMRDASLASIWDDPRVWVDGDVAPSNLETPVGDEAVIDFGGTAVGDPVGVPVIAWNFFESWVVLDRACPFDDAT